MKYFSFLIPTRERTHMLTDLFESLIKTTHDLSLIEILFAVDTDDDRTKEFLETSIVKYKDILDIKYYLRERSILLNEDYYNWLAKKATGQFFWILGDDVSFTKEGWDIEIKIGLDAFCEAHKDTIVCASIHDNTPPPSSKLPKFPCFPLFSRKVLEINGFLLHPKIPTWGADYVSYVTFEPIKRLLEFKNGCYLNHKSWHTRQVEVDNVNERIGYIFNQLKNVPHHNIQRIIEEEIPTIRGKMKDFIEGRTKNAH